MSTISAYFKFDLGHMGLVQDNFEKNSYPWSHPWPFFLKSTHEPEILFIFFENLKRLFENMASQTGNSFSRFQARMLHIRLAASP